MSQSEELQREPQLRRVMGPGLLLLFVISDIMGTGIYAMVGHVAAEVGGVAWLPFLVAFIIATVTAFSYLELVTKYPQDAGAALYTQKAFRSPFLTFVVAFVVMSAGITSAATAARFFAANLVYALHLNSERVTITAIALAFIIFLAAVNRRGVDHSLRLNVTLAIIEFSGLFLVLLVGVIAVAGGSHADFSRVVEFHSPGQQHFFLAFSAATSLAFFAMTGFEDSANMVEETKDPITVFPKVLLTGLSIAGVVYILIAIVSVALVPLAILTTSDTPLVDVVEAGAPHLPIKDLLPYISMVAVSNTALVNMLMTSRLVYGMARQGQLPPVLGTVGGVSRAPWVAIVFTTSIALAVIIYVTVFIDRDSISILGGTTSLLLLAVFAVVNLAVLVLRRDVRTPGSYFATPTALPVIGFLASLYLISPLSGRPHQQYQLAGLLLGAGVLLALIAKLVERRRTAR